MRRVSPGDPPGILRGSKRGCTCRGGGCDGGGGGALRVWGGGGGADRVGGGGGGADLDGGGAPLGACGGAPLCFSLAFSSSVCAGPRPCASWIGRSFAGSALAVLVVAAIMPAAMASPIRSLLIVVPFPVPAETSRTATLYSRSVPLTVCDGQLICRRRVRGAIMSKRRRPIERPASELAFLRKTDAGS